MDECCPVQTKHKKAKFRKQWMTSALSKSSETIDKLFKRYQKSPTVENKRSYCAYKNLFTTLRRTAEKIYLNNKLDLAKNNLKETWKTIKNVINKKPNDNLFPDSFEYGDKILKNPEELLLAVSMRSRYGIKLHPFSISFPNKVSIFFRSSRLGSNRKISRYGHHPRWVRMC